MPKRVIRNVERGEPIALTVNGDAVSAFTGETLATILLAEGITTFNITPGGQPRGPFCNMGTCFECQVMVSGAGSSVYRWQRACTLTAVAGMNIKTGACVLQSGAESVGR